MDSDCLVFVHFSVNRMVLVLVLVQRYRCWSLGLNASRLSPLKGGGDGEVQQSWFNIDSLLTHSRPQLRTELVRCLPTCILQSLTGVKSSTDYISRTGLIRSPKDRSATRVDTAAF